MNLISRIDMNRQESHLNGIVFTVAYLPKYDKFTLVTMDNNIPLDLYPHFVRGLFDKMS